MDFQVMGSADTFMVHLQHKYFVTCFALFIYSLLLVDFLLHKFKNSQFRPSYSWHVTRCSILLKHHLKYTLKITEKLWICVFSSLYWKIKKKKPPNYEDTVLFIRLRNIPYFISSLYSFSLYLHSFLFHFLTSILIVKFLLRWHYSPIRTFFSLIDLSQSATRTFSSDYIVLDFSRPFHLFAPRHVATFDFLLFSTYCVIIFHHNTEVQEPMHQLKDLLLYRSL